MPLPRATSARPCPRWLLAYVAGAAGRGDRFAAVARAAHGFRAVADAHAAPPPRPMRRHPAFDPPEYVEWRADPEDVRRYAAAIDDDPERAAVVSALPSDALLELYRDLLRTRLHDVALHRWVRTGIISKAWLGTGEEAVTVGSVAALEHGRDVVCPMIRNAGALHMMGMPLADMFRGYLATADSPTGGRDIHIGDLERGIVQPISHMGTNVPVLAGVALAFRNRGEDRVALTWVGDGASRTSAFHEGINFAAVRRLPVVYVLQNNQVALGTRLPDHMAGDPHRLPEAYGLPGWSADGNNVLDVLACTRLAADMCRAGDGPGMVVVETFRMGGHATHDEREAREAFPASLFREWGRRDPIALFEAYLDERGVPREALSTVEEEVTREIEAAADDALRSRDRVPEPERALYRGVSAGGTLVGLESRPTRPRKGGSVP